MEERILSMINEELVDMLPTCEEIDAAIDALHEVADERDRIHNIPAFRLTCLED